MREIKFRAWDTKKEFMLSNVYIGPNGEACTWQRAKTDSGYVQVYGAKGQLTTYYAEWDSVRSAPWLELMQYTGLKDKSGVEIYEGDVLKYPDGDEASYCKVVFEEGCYYGHYLFDVIQDGCSYEQALSEYASDYEIIGNIWESPELLEANNE